VEERRLTLVMYESALMEEKRKNYIL